MKKGKRLLSLLLALVLSVGMFSGLATTAFAASEQMTLYMYDLPRGGSNSAAWGHGALSLMGDSNLVIRRLDPLAAAKEKCDKCENMGWDYVVYDKRTAFERGYGNER